MELDLQERQRDRSDLHSQKENRYNITAQVTIKSEKKSERKNSHEKAGTSNMLGHGVYPTSGASTPLAYSLGHMGIGGNAIAAAASQAIAATQQVFTILMLKQEVEVVAVAACKEFLYLNFNITDATGKKNSQLESVV